MVVFPSDPEFQRVSKCARLACKRKPTRAHHNPVPVAPPLHQRAPHMRCLRPALTLGPRDDYLLYLPGYIEHAFNSHVRREITLKTHKVVVVQF